MMRRALPILVLGAALAAPAVAGAAPKADVKVVPRATVRIRIGHLHGGRAPILGIVPVIGSLHPFAPHQKVAVSFYLNGRRIKRKTVKVRRARGDRGAFRTKILVRRAGKYAASARHDRSSQLGPDSTVRKSWRVSFPALHAGQCGRVVKGFKRALAKMGYASGGGWCFNGRARREVLAYRKVNGKAPTEHAGKGLVKRVFARRGGYRVRYPKAGEHAEVPLSKQVLVLAKGGRPFAIYPVSTGKPSTPTVTGHYYFYLRSPGYNSEGMYYSFYWYNGYAVHGYASVPNYPASHGCIRTYLADQPRIYYQLDYGESIFVF